METLIKNLTQALLDILFPREKLDITSEDVAEKAKRSEWNDKDIFVLFDYKDKIPKKLIWELKYKNRPEAARILAELIYAEMLESLNNWATFEDFKDPVLIPVPISKEKLKKRGYNQIEMLVEEISKLDGGINMKHEFGVVTKKKNTADQSSLKTKSDRTKNLKNCFKVLNPSKIEGRNIVVIDDVITTGSTIKEIKKVLKKAGARKIKAFIVAH